MKRTYLDAAGDTHAVQIEAGDDGLEVTVGEQTFLIRGEALTTGRLHLHIDGRPQPMTLARKGSDLMAAIGSRRLTLTRDTGGNRRRGGNKEGEGSLTSPMPGQVLKVMVKEGDDVTKGQTLLIIEAMKMEHAIKAPFDGQVDTLPFSEGDMVTPGAALAVLSPRVDSD